MCIRDRSSILKPKHILSLATGSSESEPSSFKEAMCHPKWKTTMFDEFDALISNNTCKFVPYTNAHNLLVSKWVLSIKYNSDGSLTRYKARLVAVGNHQQAGIDYHDTFAPVVHPATIHLVLSLDVTHKRPIHQLDVKNAFLHGVLTETVYMRQPPDFTDPHFPSHVCHFRKAIYDLKQVPRA